MLFWSVFLYLNHRYQSGVGVPVSSTVISTNIWVNISPKVENIIVSSVTCIIIIIWSVIFSPSLKWKENRDASGETMTLSFVCLRRWNISLNANFGSDTDTHSWLCNTCWTEAYISSVSLFSESYQWWSWLREDGIWLCSSRPSSTSTSTLSTTWEDEMRGTSKKLIVKYFC